MASVYEGIGLLDQNQTEKIRDINRALSDLSDKVSASLTVAMANANKTLTDDEALLHLFFDCTGTLSAGRNLVVPTNQKKYIVRNSTSGGFAITVKTSGGTGVAVAAGTVQELYCDGTNVIATAAAV